MPRRQAIIAIAILFMIAITLFAGLGTNLNFKSPKTTIGYFSSSSDPYSESLAIYITSTEAFWQANLVGGNISLGSSFALPSGVTGFSLVLTHYSSWDPTFETFTKYGLGLLGPNEPMPNATLLTINTTSATAASALAQTLGQKFALAFA